RDIVLDPHRHDQDEPDHKREADEVMRILGCLREAAKRLWADHWQEQDLAEGDVQTGQAENNEGSGRQPMRESLKSVEAVHLLPGPSGRNPEPSDGQVADP